MNPGKEFERAFSESAKKEMAIIRLHDPAASFGKSDKLRFSYRNICDFIGYQFPSMYLFELKSHLGKSIPFKNIITGKTDTRLKKMCEIDTDWDAMSLFVFNWRDVENKTHAVKATDVKLYMETADRKSIPYGWTVECGVEVKSYKKISRYTYDIAKFLVDIYNLNNLDIPKD